MKELWVPVSGAIAQQRKVEIIANNVANINTPGFKKDQIIFKEHLAAAKNDTDINLPNKEWSPEDFYKSYGAENAQVKVDGTYTDFSQGSFQNTGNPLDLAIKGNGLFEILTSNGIRYGRRGTFSINELGHLVTNEGDFVLSKQDENKSRDLASSKIEERKILIPPGKILINQQGNIFVGEKNIGQLSIVEFKDMSVLRKTANGKFMNNKTDNIKSSEELKSMVLQGTIEQANINAISEMSNLIQAHRQFESIQRVIKAYDSITGRSVNEIAKF